MSRSCQTSKQSKKPETIHLLPKNSQLLLVHTKFATNIISHYIKKNSIRIIMITFNSSCIKKEKFQRHAVRKFTTLLAVSTTIFLLCVKNVKAFAAPLSSPALLNENTLMFLATGAHSIAKRWKTTGRSSSSILETQKMLPIQIKAVFVPHPFAKSHRTSLTSLTMAFGFGVPSPSTPAPPMLDMKTSINAFGSWYNSMDPVARPPVYDE